MPKYFNIPFATSGDRTVISDTNIDGSVSFTNGWGTDYEADLATQVNAKSVERNVMNTLFYDITDNIGHYQRSTFPEWIAPDKKGNTYPYAKGVTVWHKKVLYVSMADNNTSIPGVKESKWHPAVYQRSSKDEVLSGVDHTTIVTPKMLQLKVSSITPSMIGAISKTDADKRFVELKKIPELISNSFSGTLDKIGYQRLPSGLLIQWGSYSGSKKTFNFPVPFTKFCVVVRSGKSNGDLNYDLDISYTLTTFSVSNAYQHEIIAVGI